MANGEVRGPTAFSTSKDFHNHKNDKEAQMKDLEKAGKWWQEELKKAMGKANPDKPNLDTVLNKLSSLMTEVKYAPTPWCVSEHVGHSGIGANYCSAAKTMKMFVWKDKLGNKFQNGISADHKYLIADENKRNKNPALPRWSQAVAAGVKHTEGDPAAIGKVKTICRMGISATMFEAAVAYLSKAYKDLDDGKWLHFVPDTRAFNILMGTENGRGTAALLIEQAWAFPKDTKIVKISICTAEDRMYLYLGK